MDVSQVAGEDDLLHQLKLKNDNENRLNARIDELEQMIQKMWDQEKQLLSAAERASADVVSMQRANDYLRGELQLLKVCHGLYSYGLLKVCHSLCSYGLLKVCI